MTITRKPDEELTKLFGINGAAVREITGKENRMMICDSCSNAENAPAGGVKTNHKLNEQLEWVCLVCGYNADQGMMDDENTLNMIGATVRLLAQMDKTRQWRWIVLLLKTISDECGFSTMRDIANWMGRENFNG